jgi:putative transcriptional regulator
MKERVINKVKKIRLELELTQEDLAKKVGVSRQSIISIEQGRYIPSLPLALKFAELFQRPTDDIFQLLEE